jgi:two-component system OmpR family sensor kinase/two-component system sensor histidine kinase BaeS
VRGRLAWRLAALLGVLFVLAVGITTVLLSAAAIAFRLVPVPAVAPAVWGAAGAVALLLVAGLWLAGGALRRFALPVADLVETAGRLADGDYGARVVERGPPAVRRLAVAFNQMATRLEAQQTERRNLLAEIAHELRTPLAVMQGNLEGLLDGVYPRDDAHLSAVLDETHVLAALVDDLRTIALAEAGALPLRREPVDLAVLLQDAVAPFAGRAEAAGIALTHACPPGQPLLDLDPVRIRQVVANLVTNALQHTPGGGRIQVACERRSAGGGAGEVSVSVVDTGTGIAPEDLPHVFARFYKSKTSRGSGLGLAIAQQLVLLHGGRITAESRVGHGTTIRFTLPLNGT